MVVPRALVLAVCRSLCKRVAVYAVVLAISLALMSISPALGILFLLLYSCRMIVRSSRVDFPLTRLTALLPGAMALASFGVQLFVFSGARDFDPAFPLLGFLAGLLPGWLLGRSHRVFRKNGQVYARRTYLYVAVWALTLLITQGGAILGFRAIAGYALAASGFSASILATLSAVLLGKRGRGKPAAPLAAISRASMSLLPALLPLLLILGLLPPAGAVVPVDSADDAAGLVLKSSDFDRPLRAKWSSWGEFLELHAARYGRQESGALQASADDFASLGYDMGSVAYFGNIEGDLYAGSKLVLVYNPAKWEWVTSVQYQVVYGILSAVATTVNRGLDLIREESTDPVRLHARKCGRHCVLFSFQCATFAFNDAGPWTALVTYDLSQRRRRMVGFDVYETYEYPDLETCFWQSGEEIGYRLIRTVDARLRDVDYAYASGMKPDAGPVAYLLGLVREMLLGTGKFSNAAVAAGLAIALVQLLAGAGMATAMSAAEAGAREHMGLMQVLDQSEAEPGDLEKPPPEAASRESAAATAPPLTDPDTQARLVVHDGVSDYGEGYEGGKRGQVWYDDRWMDREQAEELLRSRAEQNGARPAWVHPEYEREQLEWWRSNLEDEQMRLESYRRHRQGDPDFQERVKDMERTVDYYREKLQEQQERMRQWQIVPGEHRPVDSWDPFAFSESELKVRRWDEAWRKYEAMREGAEKREHRLYGDPGKWDQAMERIFKEDGEVDYQVLGKARAVFARAIGDDVDSMAPQERHWMVEGALQTKNDMIFRIGIGYLTGGVSEAVLEPFDQLERMEEYVRYHDKNGGKGSSLSSWFEAFSYGVRELAKDKFAVRELRMLATGEVILPDGTVRREKAGAFERALSLVSVGLKGKEWHSTVAKGKFWEMDAFNLRKAQVEDVSGPSGGAVRTRSVIPGGPDAPGRGGARGAELEASRPGVAAAAAAAAGPPEGPRIPPEMMPDYTAMQRALDAGDDAGATRHAGRMLLKNYDLFQLETRGGRMPEDVARRAVSAHHDIVSQGSAEGMRRAKNMGALLQDRVLTENGRITQQKVIKNVFAPGSALDEFRGKIPGDTDLTPNIDRRVAALLGVDAEDLQAKTAGHIQDGINDAARRILGDDIGNDYCRRTRIKLMEPGSPEEYHSYKAHSLTGGTIDSDGNIQRNSTTLGQQLWPGIRPEITDAINNSRTGQAMVAADEYFQVNKILREFDAIQNPTPAQKAEFARELAKHHLRTENGAAWKLDDIEADKLQFARPGAAADKLAGFQETLEKALLGDPAALDAAVRKNYGGAARDQYRVFYEDVRQSHRQAAQTRLDQGGKIFDAQADRLKQTGVRVREDTVIKPAAGAEDAGKFLDRMGVETDLRKYVPQNEPALKTVEAERAYQKLMQAQQPEGYGPPKSETKDQVLGRARAASAPGPGETPDGRLHQLIQGLREKDPVFRELDDRVNRALIDGQSRRIMDVSDDHRAKMQEENLWGPPESTKFQEELGRRVNIDPRLQDPTAVKYQEHRLHWEGVTPEQLDRWLEVRQKLRRGVPVEPWVPSPKPDPE